MKKIVLLCALACIAMISAPVFAADIGVVFMHGKWAPGNSSSPVYDEIKRAGFLLETPEMPWSQSRAYDRDTTAAMAEVDAAVAKLKSRGAERIVVGGQSMGANFAVAYASRRDGIAGVMAIAPGHVPELSGYQANLKGDVERAKKLVADGKGDVRDRFNDNNQGQDRKMPSTASIYLSWFDPAGLMVMPRNAARLKSETALLWLVGEQDGMAQRGEGYAFARAPANPKSAYKLVSGGHSDAGAKAAHEIAFWLKNL
jgi:pimeloyl-ACP methyl ester carboxylesterase